MHYQTKLSQAGLNVSNYVSNIVRKGVNVVFAYIDKKVNENK